MQSKDNIREDNSAFVNIPSVYTELSSLISCSKIAFVNIPSVYTELSFLISCSKIAFVNIPSVYTILEQDIRKDNFVYTEGIFTNAI